MGDRDERAVPRENIADWERWAYTARGRMPPSWRDAIADDVHLRDARVVVDLVFARVRRVTVMAGLSREMIQSGLPEPLRITSRTDGRDVLVTPAMIEEPELVDQIALDPGAGVSAGGRTIEISVWGEIVDPKSLIASGFPMNGEAEVSLVYPGMAWEDRLVYLRGMMTSVSHGGLRELVTISITDPVYTGAEIPPYVLDATRWPQIQDSAIGERVPIVVNSGYRVPSPRVIDGYPGAFLLAQGHRWTVDKVFVDQWDMTADVTVAQTADSLGLPVTAAYFTSAVAASVGERSTCYAQIRDETVNELGVVAAAKRLLTLYGEGPRRRLDLELFGEASRRLGLLGAAAATVAPGPAIVVNAPTRAYDYLEATLFEEHPMICLAWEGAGVGPVVVDALAEPIADLAVDRYPILARAVGGDYQWSSVDEIRNRFTLRYNHDARLDQFAGVQTRSPANSTLCAWSQSEYEDRPWGDREAITIRDDGTAAYVLDWLVEHLARPAATVVVDAFPEAWLRLRRGDTVRWTDPQVGFRQARAIVMARRRTPAAVQLTLRVLPELPPGVFGGTKTVMS